jgi:hypothetical protein
VKAARWHGSEVADPIHSNVNRGHFADAAVKGDSHIFPEVKVDQHYDEVLQALGG